MGISKKRNKQGFKEGIGNFAYIDGRYSKKHYCVNSNCNNEIGYTNWKYGNQECNPCASKHRIIKQNHYCIEKGCDKKISYNSWKYGKGRCKSCSKKDNRHPLFGKKSPLKGRKVPKDVIEKIAKKLRGRKYSQEYKIKMSQSCKGINKGRKNGMSGVHRYGENAPNWQGGISFEPYPLGWTKNYKEEIRKRDNYTCQICDKKEIELKEFHKKLSVHHIDYNKKNLDPKNLVSLCRKCHLKTNGNRDYWYAYFMYVTNQEIKL